MNKFIIILDADTGTVHICKSTIAWEGFHANAINKLCERLHIRISAIQWMEFNGNLSIYPPDKDAPPRLLCVQSILTPVKTWKSENPPQDGTRFLAVGHVINKSEDSTVVVPFARAIYWSLKYKSWLDAHSDLAIASYFPSEVKIFHWTELPE